MRRLAAALCLGTVLLSAAPAVADTLCFNAGSTSPATVPASWNNAANTIEAIGGGGDGGVATTGGFGGGGSAGYSRSSNVTLTPGASVGFQIGVHGGTSSSTAATWFCSATTGCANANDTKVVVSAKGGVTSTATGGGNGAVGTGVIGTAAIVIGQSGGSGSSTHGGGSGAAPGGPNGGGTAGINGTTSGGGAGVLGDGGVGGAGGVGGTASVAPGAGTAGTEIDGACPLPVAQGGTIAVGAGGSGGGGALATNLNGANGAAFGAGGGGTGPTGGAGTPGQGGGGVVRLSWTPTVAASGAKHGMLTGIGP